MYTSFVQSIDTKHRQSGSALVVAVIVLAILGTLGIAALDVADLNMFIAANDRDTKAAFFHADSGVNMGHEFLEDSIHEVNSTFYGNDGNLWGGNSTFVPANFPLQLFIDGPMATHIRAGQTGSEFMEGAAIQMAAGYEGIGKSAAHGGVAAIFLIRAHRIGQRNSQAEVDLGWRHVLN